MSDTKIACPECKQIEMVIKNGKNSKGDQKFKCKNCNVNYIDNGTHEDNTEVVPENNGPSMIAKHVTQRENYRNEFPEPRYSEKYDFKFNSWKEYFHKRAPLVLAEKKRKELEDQNKQAEGQTTLDDNQDQNG